MSPRSRAEVEAQLEQMARLASDFCGPAQAALVTPPGTVELAALAAMLHAFYTGVENIFKRIAVEFPPGGGSTGDWHAALLESAGRSVAGRAAMMSPDLVARLKPYMQFRHVFRHAYTFDLQWDKMRPLVEGFGPLREEVDRAVRSFLAS